MKTILKIMSVSFVFLGLLSATALAAGQNGCITCHADDAKMKGLVTFIPPLAGEGEG